MNQIPFDITRYEEEKFNTDIIRFKDLYDKYKNDVDEVLEFAKLYNQFVLKSNGKWS